VSSARRRKKLAKKHLTWRTPPHWSGARAEDTWEAGKGAATSARYDKRYYRLQVAGQLEGIVGWQAPVKYNRCKLCNYRRHCAPDLVDMKISQGKTGRKIT
jgi:hypothetical protein